MAAICNGGPISAVPTTKQLLVKKKTCAKFQIDTPKAEGLRDSRIYTRTIMAKSNQLLHYIYMFRL